MTKRVWLACLLLGLTAGASAAQGGFELRLIEPAEHVDVVAGSTVPIAWDAVNEPAGAEEWEAFVSIDGGRTYPIRITPHLDHRIRRFTWTVPALPGAEVSILLRVGNEQEEREFRFPSRMRITGALSLQLLRQGGVRETAFVQDETEGDHGQTLIAWVDGSREGSDLRQVVVDDSRLVGEHEWNRYRDHDSAPVLCGNSKPPDDAMSVARSRGDEAARNRQEQRGLRHHRAGILLLSRRLNI